MAGYLGNLTVDDESDEENEQQTEAINQEAVLEKPEAMEVEEGPVEASREDPEDLRAKRLERFKNVPKKPKVTQVKAKPKKEKVASKPKKKKDPVNMMLMNAFKFSLNPVFDSEFLYLSQVRKEVAPKATDSDLISLNETTIEAALNFRLFQTKFKAKAGYGVFSYLIQSLERLDKSLRRTDYFSAETVEKMNKAGEVARKITSSYCHTALTEASLFGDEFEAISVAEFITVLKDVTAPGGSVVHLLLPELAKEAESQDSMEDVFLPVLKILEKEMREATASTLPFLTSPVMALQTLLKIKPFAKYFASLVSQQETKLGSKGWETPTTIQTPNEDEMTNLSGMEAQQTDTLLAQNEIVHNMLRLLQTMHRQQTRQKKVEGGKRIEMESILAAFFAPSPLSRKFTKNVFPNVHLRTQKEVDQKFTYVRNLVSGLHFSLHDVILSLCKASSESRNATMAWVSRTLQLNEGREKMQPDKLKVSGDGLSLNLASVLLRLCRPFVEVDKIDIKLALIEPEFVATNGGSVSRAYPQDKTTLAEITNTTNRAKNINSVDRTEQQFKFVTQCFFYALRAFHLGPMSCMRRIKSLRRRAGYMRRVLPREMLHPNAPDSEEKKTYEAVLRQLYTVMAASLEPDTIIDALKVYAALSKVIMKLGSTKQDQSPTIPLQSPPNQVITNLPEHFITDCTELLIILAHNSPEVLGRMPPQLLENILTMFTALIASPNYVKSPHVRAGIAEAIFEVYLPDTAKGSEYEEMNNKSFQGEQLIRGNLLSQNSVVYDNLAPALLLLYGDVEDTGYYESAGHRHHIALILKYIWERDNHRPAFRKFALDDTDVKSTGAQSSTEFVKFANGIINQTNDGIAGSLQRLRQIKTIQVEMQKYEIWNALTEEEQKQRQEKLQEDERHVESTLLLANEVTTMIKYLSTDSHFVDAFMNKVLVTRLAGMLSSIVSNLAGKRGLDFRIDNPEKYNFHPEDLLNKVFYILLRFARIGGDRFVKAVAECGFYQYSMFRKIAVYFKQRAKVSESESAEFLEFNEKMKEAAEAKEKENSRDQEAPEEFLDPLVFEVMEDPVKLPGSGKIIDRTTILQHLLNDPHDPFNRQPLEASELIDQPDLKAKIQKWKTGDSS